MTTKRLVKTVIFQIFCKSAFASEISGKSKTTLDSTRGGLCECVCKKKSFIHKLVDLSIKQSGPCHSSKTFNAGFVCSLKSGSFPRFLVHSHQSYYAQRSSALPLISVMGPKGLFPVKHLPAPCLFLLTVALHACRSVVQLA